MEKKTNTSKEKVESMPNKSKRRAVISYAKFKPDLVQHLKRNIKGYADYMGDIFKVDKPEDHFFMLSL